MFKQEAVVDIRCDRPHARPGQRASGYLLDERHALTVAHILGPLDEGGRGWLQQVTSDRWVVASVTWRDTAADLALLELSDAAEGTASTTEVGDLTGNEALHWQAVGFPTNKRSEPVWGRASPIPGVDARHLALTVESRQARDMADGKSGWRGISGAAVFCDDYLVGVVTSDPGAFERGLEAVRVTHLVGDEAFAAALGRALTSVPVRGSTKAEPPARPGQTSSKLIRKTRQDRHIRVFDGDDDVDIRTMYRGVLAPTVETYVNGELCDSFSLTNRAKYPRTFTASTHQCQRKLTLIFYFPKAAIDINPLRRLDRLEVYLDGRLVYPNA